MGLVEERGGGVRVKNLDHSAIEEGSRVKASFKSNNAVKGNNDNCLWPYLVS